jgi:hypothetical protein
LNSILVMCGIRVLLIQKGIGLAALTGGDGGDSAVDGGDGVGDSTSSSDIASGLLYMLKNHQFNSGDVRYSRFVDTDMYWAGSAHRWGWR